MPGSFQRGLRFADEQRQFQERRETAPLRRQAAQQDITLGDLRISAAERKKEFFEARRALVLIGHADTPERWDEIAAKAAPDLVGQFGRREELTATYRAIIEALDPQTPDKPIFFKGQRGAVNQIVPDGQGGFTFKEIVPVGDEAAGKPSALDQKVAALMATGLTLAQAQGIASGRFKVGGDPPRVVDVATGKIVGEAPQAAATAAPLPAEDTLFGQAEQGTGLLSTAGSVSSDILGQLPLVGGLFVFEDIVKARQDFASAKQAMLQAFVVNNKFPVAEVNRISDEIGAVSGAFTSPDAMRIRLRALDRFLRRKVAFQQQVSNDPNIASKERGEAATNARNMLQFLDAMGVPPDGGGNEIIDLRNEGGAEAATLPPLDGFSFERVQ